MGPLLVLVVSIAACTAPQVRYRPLSGPLAPGGVASVTLFLVGDAGEATAGRDSVLAHLSIEVDSASVSGRPVLVAYLGDNIYDVGAREGSDADRERLAAQLRPISSRPNVRAVFVPGNHDWAKGSGGAPARRALVLQARWIEEMAAGRDVALMPGDGCPGPATIDVGPVHLIMADTESLLRDVVEDCRGSADFYARLEEDLRANAGRPTVFLAHHPMATGGPHGGNVAPLTNGPFIFYLATKSGVSRQDLASVAYSGMIARLQEAFEASGSPPLIHAAGHDHNLQIIGLGGPGQPDFQLVSGSGAKNSSARRVPGMRYASDENGYMRVDFRDDQARLVVYGTQDTGGPVRPLFECMMTYARDDDDCPEALLAGGSP